MTTTATPEVTPERLRTAKKAVISSSIGAALEWFDVVAGEHPDRAAVTIADPGVATASWSYGELARRSDQVASWLRGLGVRAGDPMIVMLNNTIDLWNVKLCQNRGKITEIILDEVHLAGNIGQSFFGSCQRRGVLVNTDQPALVAELFCNPARMPGAAQGAVHINSIRLYHQSPDRFFQQYAYVMEFQNKHLLSISLNQPGFRQFP